MYVRASIRREEGLCRELTVWKWLKSMSGAILVSLSAREKLASRAELHKIPARVQCTVQCADWIDEPAPPTIP
jgi:hypothetical protein